MRAAVAVLLLVALLLVGCTEEVMYDACPNPVDHTDASRCQHWWDE